jgi:hypothetical protein
MLVRNLPVFLSELVALNILVPPELAFLKVELLLPEGHLFLELLSRELAILAAAEEASQPLKGSECDWGYEGSHW